MTLEEAKALKPGQQVHVGLSRESSSFLTVARNTDTELAFSAGGGSATMSFNWTQFNDHTVSTWTLVPEQPAPCLVGENSPAEG